MPSTKLLATAVALACAGAVDGELINVNVGEGGLYFVHPDITANPGDIVAFSFGGPSGGPGGNHSVTESAAFSTPCLPKEGGFNSGFVSPTAAEADAGGVSFLLTINDTNPIWYYCAQIGHCQGGMVGSINADLSAGSSETFEDFSSLARQATTTSIASTTGGGVLFTGHPSSPSTAGPSTLPGASFSTTLPGDSTFPGASLSTLPGGSLSTLPGGSLSTLPGASLSTLPVVSPSTLPGASLSGLPPPPSATATSSTQTATGTTTVSSTASSSSTTSSAVVSTAAATPAAGRPEWAGFVAACFMPLFIVLA